MAGIDGRASAEKQPPDQGDRHKLDHDDPAQLFI